MSKPPICRRLGDHCQRRAVSGILAAVILFAMLFVVGMGYLIYINQASQTVVQANAARQGAELISGKESLTTRVTLSGGAPPNYLVVSANNTGGTSSVISYIYVTDLSGKLVSNFMGPAPQAGTNATALWPISLSAGQSTGLLKGCVSAKTGCNIELTGYTYSGSPVMVEVVTKSGNTFGARYPPASGSLNQPNPLVVSMVATPPQVFSCNAPNCITLTVTVYNYALSPVTNVQLDPSPPTALVTGTAGVGVFGGSCSAPSPSSTIPAYTSGNPSSITFTCSYSSTTGPVGGFASFSGGALGTLGVGAAASAQAISNTIQIGGNSNVPTQGAFAANYFFLEYSACQNGPSGSVGSYSYSPPCNTAPATMPPANLNALADGNYISGFSDFYVAYYVQVTNVFNTTLPILEYSYLFADPGISAEAYSFLVGTVATPYFPNYCNNVSNPCASNDLPQLTAYTATPTTCTNNPNQCIEVAPGQTVTLTFAACGYGSSNWVWAGTPYGRYLDNPTGCVTTPPGYIQPTTGQVEVPEGQTLSIVLSYMYKNQVYLQSMPFEGQTVTNLRTTSTTLTCSPPTDPVNAPSSCTVTVTDLSAGTAVTPTGTVTISQDPLTGGTFSNGGSCALSGSGAVATCTFTYIPGLGQEQSDYLTASYPGDTSHSGSSSPTISITATQRSTSTSVVCNPSTNLPNMMTTCVVTVSDTSPPTTVVPTGKVTLTQSPASSGMFTNSSGTYTAATCTLASGQCSVTYTPQTNFIGTVTITGSYGGDTDHSVSSNSANVIWSNKHTTSLTVGCPATTPNVATTCTFTVADTSSGTPITPTGTVDTFSDGGKGGSFGATSCTLSAGVCTVTYTPVSAGSITISAKYEGDVNHFTSTGSGTLTVSGSIPTLTLSTNTGTVGTTITLSGSGYLASTLYAYCFSSSATAACPSGTSTTFTTTAGGAIPSGVTIVVPHSGHNYVDVNKGNTGTNFIISAPFTIRASLVQAQTLCGSTPFSSSSCSVALANSVIAGDELIVTVSDEIGTSATCITVSSISDGLGSSFTATPSGGVTASGSGEAGHAGPSCVYTVVYYATLGSGGADSITVHLSGTPYSAVVQAYEVAGVAATPTEVPGTCTSTTGSCTLNMATTSASYSSYSFLAVVGDIWFHHIGSAGTGAPTGFTTAVNVAQDPGEGLAGYEIPTASGTGVTFGMTAYAAANSWAEEVAIFAPDASPTASVSCASTSLSVGSTSQCLATLTGFSGSITGETITWAQTGGTGSVSFSAGTCALSAEGSCVVTVTGQTSGTASIQASYPGDYENAASQNSLSVTVTGKPPVAEGKWMPTTTGLQLIYRTPGNLGNGLLDQVRVNGWTRKPMVDLFRPANSGCDGGIFG